MNVPTYFTTLVVDGVTHLVHGMVQPGRDAENRITFRAECQRELVYARTLAEDEAKATDCPECAALFTPEGVRRVTCEWCGLGFGKHLSACRMAKS